MMGDLSTHFNRSEFDSHDGAKATPAVELVGRLEALRCIVGRPLVIVSGYRSPAQNKAVGGAKESQHLVNRAADLIEGVATLGQARQAGFTGIGVRHGYAVHVDVRPGPLVIFDEP